MNDIADKDYHFAACDQDCTDQANWAQTLITLNEEYNYEVMKYPSLAFTGQGQPRVVADLMPLSSTGEAAGIYYVACDVACENEANWRRIGLYNRGSGVDVSWDLELDSTGRPHLAYYQGQGDDQGEQLYYALTRCDTRFGLSLAFNSSLGQAADQVTLDGQGKNQHRQEHHRA